MPAQVLEVDLFDKSVSVPLTLHPLSTVEPDEPEVLDLREKLEAATRASLDPLETYLNTLRMYEPLLQRNEGEYVTAFAEEAKEPKTLQEIESKVLEQRVEKAKIEAEVPSTVLIGTYLLHTSTLKTMLLEKFDRTCELLMKLICERGREQAAELSKQFSDMCAPQLPRAPRGMPFSSLMPSPSVPSSPALLTRSPHPPSSPALLTRSPHPLSSPALPPLDCHLPQVRHATGAAQGH